jgi:hypothetical protein
MEEREELLGTSVTVCCKLRPSTSAIKIGAIDL